MGKLQASSFIRLQNLLELNNSTIQNIEQDEKGEIIIKAREGLFYYNGYSMYQMSSSEEFEINNKQIVLSDKYGNKYEATGHGLILHDKHGKQEELPLQGVHGLPVTCIFADRDDNIWVGTYYNGVFFKGAHSECIKFVDTPTQMRNLRSLICDNKEQIWAFTDNFGAFLYSQKSETWKTLPGFDGLKIQNSYYDEENERIWAFESEKGLFSIDCNNFRIVFHNDCTKTTGYSYALLWNNGELLLGGPDGLFKYNPATSVTMRIPEIKCPVYDILQDKNGKIWIAGGGLFSNDKGKISREDDIPALSDEICHDIDADLDGNIWIAVMGYGVVRFSNGKTALITEEENGLSSDFVNTVTCTDNRNVVIGSRKGISIYNDLDKTIQNYGENSGVGSNSTAGRSSILLPDGTVWVGNNNNITIFNEKNISTPINHTIAISRVFIDGKPITFDESSLTLNYKQSFLSIYLSDYDFERIRPTKYEYNIKGKHNNQANISLSSPLLFSEMSPGIHEIEILQTDFNTGIRNATSLPIRVTPAWHSSLIAKIIYLLLAVIIAYAVIKNYLTKKNLKERLRLSEIEKEKSSNFYVDLSYNLRTPINLIVGMFKQFFKSYGQRSAGVEQLEEIFENSIKIREIVSQHIDSQEALYESAPKSAEGIRKNVRFINAATGSIERHLFEGNKINVGILCNEMNMGKTQLTAKMKEISGVTPRQFIEDVKLKHARTLLESGKMRINEISSLLNFSSPGYFSLKFKNKYGFSPNEIRKN